MAQLKPMRIKRREVHSSDEMDYLSPSVSSSRGNKRMKHSILPPMDQILQSMSQQQQDTGTHQTFISRQPQTARPSAKSRPCVSPAQPNNHLSDSSSYSDSNFSSNSDSDTDDHVCQSATSYESEADCLDDDAHKPTEPIPTKDSPPSGCQIEEEEAELIRPKPCSPIIKNASPPLVPQRDSPAPEVSTNNQQQPSITISNPTTTTANSQLLTDALMNLHCYMDKLMDSHKDFIQAVKLGLDNMRMVLDKV